MTFFELLKRADAIATEEKTIIIYKADGNGTKTVKKSLISLKTLYNMESISGLYADFSEPERAVIYKDFSPCWEVQTIYNDTEADKMQIALIRYNQAMGNYMDFCDMIQNKINNGDYIKNDALMLLQLHGNTELLLKATREKQIKIEASAKAEAEEARKYAEEERKRAEAEAEEKARQKAEKMSFLQGYGEGKTQIQIERIYDVLSKIQGYREGEKVNCKSRKDFIIDTLAEGGKAEQKDGVISYYGSRWNPKQSKPKTEYRLYTAEGSYYTITKIEYDFAS